MRTIIVVGLAGLIFAGPTLAQNTTAPNSGAGVPGQHGTKSGPAAHRDQNTGKPSQDQSKVPGLPGNKSGPAVQPQKSTK
jgi:hypothetical protein